MNLEELKKEYQTQDNACTAYPIYIQVQELVCIGVIADGYSVNCPFGDGETRTEYRHDQHDETFDNRSDLIKQLKEDNELEDWGEEIAHIECFEVGYIWHTVEIFLTTKGAEEYMRADKHNHGKLRTYVNHFNRRNFEMRGILKDIGFKVED